MSNFAKGESGDQITLLCKTHYFKRFHEGGAYLGGEKYEKMSARDSLKSGTAAAAQSPVRTSESAASTGSSDAAAPSAADDAAAAPTGSASVSERRQSFKGASLPATGVSVGAAASTPAAPAVPAAESEPEAEPSSGPPPVHASVFETATLAAAVPSEGDAALDTTAELGEEEVV